MTRETKIGLLMGLGFIVVFAVLLLQTGPERPHADEMTMLVNMQGESAARRPESGARLPEPVGVQQPSTIPSTSGIESVPEALTRASEPWHSGLPNPPILDARPDYRDMGPGHSAMTENLTPEPRSGPDAERLTPVQVELPNDVRPTHRPDEPESSPPPSPPTPPRDVAPSPSDRTHPADELPTPYVVQRRDSLSKIARKHYNNDSTSVLDFLVRYNSDKVKNKDWVIEGQTLLIPVLPVHLRVPEGGSEGEGASASREPVHLEESASPAPPRSRPVLRPLNAERVVPPSSVLVKVASEGAGAGGASKVGPMALGSSSPIKEDGAALVQDRSEAAGQDGPKAASTTEKEPRGSLRNEHASSGGNPKRDTGQKRPSAGTKAADKKSAEAADRWYTIRPKDTLSSIADRYLGGRHNWEDIVKLNKSIKPTKLRAGERIRLPVR